MDVQAIHLFRYQSSHAMAHKDNRMYLTKRLALGPVVGKQNSYSLSPHVSQEARSANQLQIVVYS